MSDSWTLIPDPLTPDLPFSSPNRSATGRNARTAVVGLGIVRPLTRGATDLTVASGVDLVRANVAQVLGTIAETEDSPGELPWRSEFGSALHLLRLRANSKTLAAQARIFVGQAISRWEPRARVRALEVKKPDPASDRLEIVIRWDVVDRNDPSKVIVAGLETATAVG